MRFSMLLLSMLMFTVSTAANRNHCLGCHKRIEDVRSPQSGMMKAINKIALKAGVEDNGHGNRERRQGVDKKPYL